MNKLTALAEVAKAAATIDHNEQEGWYSAEVIREQGAYFSKNAKFIAACDPDTILELCALLEKAEDALESERKSQRRIDHFKMTLEALAAIKQWKDQA